MPLRKLFSFDSDEVKHRRAQARYLEGRGVYPEGRETYANSHQDDVFYLEEPMQIDEISNAYSADDVNRRRLPLTTLDALLQIKANKLAHGRV